MGRILLPLETNFQSMVMSLFFRAPAESLARVRSSYDPEADRSRLSGILPFMIFGPRSVNYREFDIGSVPGGETTSTQYDLPLGADFDGNLYCDWRELGTNTVPFDVDALTGTKDSSPLKHQEPSWIGIDCRGPRNIFNFNFAYDRDASTADYTGTGEVLTTAVSSSAGQFYIEDVGHMAACGLPPFPNHAESKFITHQTTVDLNGGKVPNPETFGGFGASTDDAALGTVVAPDDWHHLIFSPSLGGMTTKGVAQDAPEDAIGTADSDAKLYTALDDNNLTRKALSVYMPKNSDNVWLTPGGYSVYRTRHLGSGSSETSNTAGGAALTISTSGIPFPSYKFSPSNVKFETLNIPGDNGINELVEMAGLQIFLNETMNTASLKARRVFLTDKGKPANPRLAEKWFGRKPEIKFWKRKSWFDATNEGLLGKVTIDPRSAESDGTVVGTIQKYTPDPTIEESR